MDGTTAATIPIRDANGRMQAADPASGATDKTLVTANWVSQTGDSAPNNLIHRSGNESKSGVLQFNSNFSRGCTPDDLLLNPTANFVATVFTLVDQLGQTTHNTLGSFSKVRNASGQNYIDLSNISYGFYENGVQKRIDAFIRIMISEDSGSAQVILFRQKRNADGSGTVSTTARTLAVINYNE